MKRRVNDIGGVEAGPIDRTELEVKYWQAQADAIRRALGNDIVSLDEQRRATEELDEETYASLAFFERRLVAMIHILEEKGLVDMDKLERRTKALQARRQY